MTFRMRGLSSINARRWSWLAFVVAVAIVVGSGLGTTPGALAQDAPVPAPSSPADPSEPAEATETTDTTESTGPASEPEQDEPVQDEPVQDEPVQDEPVQDESVEDDPADSPATPTRPESSPSEPDASPEVPDMAPAVPDAEEPTDPEAASAVRPLDTNVEVSQLDGELLATQAGTERWRLALRPEGGTATELLIDDDTVFVGHGLYLLGIERETGVVRTRTALPAVARELLIDADGVLQVVVDHGAEGARQLSAPGGEIQSPVRFGTDVESLHALAVAARAESDPVAAAERDPTDPWLALQVAQTTSNEAALADALDRVVAAATPLPFFETLRLADRLLTIGDVEGATTLYEDAIADLAHRNYDPRLATEPALRSAYGFPGARLSDALARGDLDEALIVAPYAWQLAAEEAPESVAALRELADGLRDDGRRDEASTWRERARALDRAGLDTWVDGLALRLGSLGWWGVTGLLAAFVLLWIVLGAKVWRAQSLARRQLKERDQAPPVVTRLWIVRQVSTTEKLVLALLLAVAGLQAALAGWHTDVQDPSSALRSGTLASVEAIAAVDELPDTPRASWVRGLSSAHQGQLDEALEHWRAAGTLAPALTDRAVAQGGDERLLDAALAADPREPVARFYSGRAADPSPFHAATDPDGPLWAVPSTLDLRLASAGDWRGALSQALTAPWAALGEARPDAVPAWIAWILALLYALFFLAVLAFLVLPRPRVSRDAPRTVGYHLGALLVPGSGHADELWGILLLVPWSLIGIDALVGLSGGSLLGLAPTTQAWSLAALWTINLIGFSVELSSYRHRMRLLRENKPELARSYGLPPAPRPEA